MEISILTFGIVREITESSSVRLELAEATTVEQLTGLLKERYPALSRLRSFAIAVNGAYASAETPIMHADEVAIIPPVSGG